MKLRSEYLMVNIFYCMESFINIYSQIKDIADFRILQGKL